jgi:small subunit ribosomal protein S20
VARSISSQKRLRQNKRRAERNKSRTSELRNIIRKVRDAVASKKLDAAEQALREANAILDRSGNRKTVHPRAAARSKSRLAKQVNLLKTAK